MTSRRARHPRRRRLCRPPASGVVLPLPHRASRLRSAWSRWPPWSRGREGGADLPPRCASRPDLAARPGGRAPGALDCNATNFAAHQIKKANTWVQAKLIPCLWGCWLHDLRRDWIWLYSYQKEKKNLGYPYPNAASLRLPSSSRPPPVVSGKLPQPQVVSRLSCL